MYTVLLLMMRAFPVACTLFCLVAHAQDLSKANRVALVIGNSGYSVLPKLQSVPKDVEAISNALKNAAFDVVSVNDFKVPEFFTQGIADFEKHLKGGDVCVVYYAGYALQSEGDNYLLPVNFDPQDQKALVDRAYLFVRLQEDLDAHGVALRIFIQEGPPPLNVAIKGAGIGLVDPQIGPFKETLFVSAGRTGEWVPTASGGGADRLTTIAAKAINEQKIELDSLFEHVRSDVTESARTGGQTQVPFHDSTVVRSQFYFHEPEKKVETPVTTLPPPPPEWPRQNVIVQNSRDREEYLWVKPQRFMMGCVPNGDKPCEDAEKPRHQVTLTKGFWIGRNEVQVDSYQRYVQANKPKTKMPSAPLDDRHWDKTDRPIVDVKWEDAKAYCGWAGGRLPTEAEWEAAARGGMRDEIYPMGSEKSRDFANFAGKSENDIYDGIAPVRKFNPNPYGLYDMSGNVWEWVNDFFGNYTAANVTDPPGPSNGKDHVIRGGSFASDAKVHLRISYRKGMSKDENNIGFRCAIDDTDASKKLLPQPR